MYRYCRVAFIGTFLFLCASSATSAQLTVRNGSASDVAGITGIRDQFRIDLGGGTTAGPNGLFDDGIRQRREINWDAVGAGFSAPNNLPADFFNVNSPRGAVFVPVGTTTAFQVSANAADGPINFGNIDVSYSTTFLQFSAQKLFTPLNGNQMDVRFFVPGTNIPGAVRGFGVIFTDVEQAGTTAIQFFGLNDESLGAFATSPQPGGAGTTGFSFLGAFVTDGSHLITRARIFLGNSALGAGVLDNGLDRDLVVMDDFIYGNPVAVPEPASLAAIGMGLTGMLVWHRRRRKRSSKNARAVHRQPVKSSTVHT